MTATTPDAAARTAPGITTDTATDAAARERRFTTAVAQLRTKVTGAQIHRWFRVAGPVLIPLGALMILLAWWGAANTTRVFLQIPYLISGAVLGLGFMFVGGFVYFARWLTDLLDAVRTESRRAEEAEARTTAALERIETLLAEAAVQPGAAPPATAPDPPATGSGQRAPTTPGRLAATTSGRQAATTSGRQAATTSGRQAATTSGRQAGPVAPAPPGPAAGAGELVATPHGKLVHLATCRMVEGRSTRPLDASDVAEREACRICLPGGLDD